MKQFFKLTCGSIINVQMIESIRSESQGWYVYMQSGAWFRLQGNESVALMDILRGA